MDKMLVVVDMVNGFAKEGALADRRILQITPNIISLIKLGAVAGVPIINFRDCHTKGDSEFKVFPEHCLKGTKESELIDELKPYEKYFAYDIPKSTTNGFITKTFQNIIGKVDNCQIIVTGCCTDICVKNFAISLLDYVKKTGKKIDVVIVADACSTFDGENHNALEEHNKALRELQTQGAKIVTMEAFKNCSRMGGRE